MEGALTLILDTNILIDLRNSVIIWIEVLVGCREGEADAVRGALATRNSSDFPLTLGGPYQL